MSFINKLNEFIISKGFSRTFNNVYTREYPDLQLKLTFIGKNCSIKIFLNKEWIDFCSLVFHLNFKIIKQRLSIGEETFSIFKEYKGLKEFIILQEDLSQILKFMERFKNA